ncbi:MAG: glycosyltransferase family 4 protein [Planctomycetota bacterium]|nr:glycosyltransferase family 4 protein [Planctomycetota bacterium]
MAHVALIGGFGDLVVKLRGTLIKALRSAGHTVTVCVPPPSAAARPGVTAGLSAMGVRLVEAPLVRAGTNPLAELALRSFYDEFMIREKPDVVIAYNPKPVFYAIPAARRAGIQRSAAMITGLGYAFTSRDLKARLLSIVAMRFYRRSLPLASTVIFQNADDRTRFEHLGLLGAVRDVQTIPGSGVDLEHFPHVPITEEPSRIDFLYLGRFLRDKGVADFAEAARALHALRTDANRFRCQVAGAVDENPSSVTDGDVQHWAKSGTLESLGRLEDPRPALAACSVMVLPSYGEGMPMAVLEAMATGRAIITTEAPGCRETIIDGESGILVPPGSPAALAVAMEQFLEDPALVVSMGQAARVRAEKLFDSRIVNARVLAALGM